MTGEEYKNYFYLPKQVTANRNLVYSSCGEKIEKNFSGVQNLAPTNLSLT